MKFRIIAILILWSLSAKSQKVNFTLTAPKAVEMGETFQLTYSVNANGSGFTGPTFTDFDYIAGPYTSSSSSTQIINNSVTRNINLSFTYQLRAKKKGAFNLPVASIIVDGKKINSNTAKIEVVSGTNQNTTSGTNSQDNSAPTGGEIPEGLVFGRTLVSKKTAYIGEPILVTQKIYSEKKIANITDFKEPTYEGFWKESIDIGDLKLDRESYGNKVYYAVTMQKMILFPQKAGPLELSSFDLKAVISILKTRKPRDQWEQWMYGNQVRTSENTSVSINSPKVIVNVKPLPESGKPADFNGVVGEFSFNVSIDKNKTEVNDAINLKIKIAGTGNVDLLDIKSPVFPTDFEVYDPKISTQSDNSVAGVKGSKSYEYLIIPRNEGDFIIAPITFSYFDVKKGKYITLASDTFRIKVGKGSGKVYVNAPTANQNQVKLLSEEIRFIKSQSSDWQSKNHHYFNSSIHLIGLISLPVILIGLLFFRQKQNEKNKNIAAMRNKKATRLAQKRLKTALKLQKANDVSGFYIEISRVLWGYLSDKFNIPLSSLSMDNVREILSSNMETNSIEEIINVLQDCEYARFAPNVDHSQLEKIYTSTLNIISKIEKSLKS